MGSRIFALVCGNGFGHLVRTVHITSALLARESAAEVTIAGDPSHVKALSAWQPLAHLLEDSRVKFRGADFYPRWSTDREYYENGRLLTWDRVLRDLKLHSFDLVLSDNFVETLRYAQRVLLVGSFFWHDIYEAYLPESSVVGRYHQECVELLATRPAEMIASRYFAMPAVLKHTRAIGVGMMPSTLGRRPYNGPRPRTVLLTGRPASAAIGSIVEELHHASDHLADSGLQLLVEKRLAAAVPMPPRALVFDYLANDFSQVGAVIARPGMGTIADCVATGTLLFAVPEANPEMAHNARRLQELGLGWQLPDGIRWLSAVVTRLADEGSARRYEEAREAIDMAGLEQAVNAVASHLD